MKDRYNVEAKNLPAPDEEEIWVPAPQYEDRYEVSNFGNVRYKKTKRVRKLGYDNSGYPIICLKVDNIVHYVYVHRLVCEAFNGPPTAERNICDHIDRCIINNYYKNLHWTNHAENNLNHKPFSKRKISLEKTPIVFLSLDGVLQQRFDNILQANEILGISIQQIQHNLRGRRRPFKNGYFRIEAEYLASLDKEKIF